MTCPFLGVLPFHIGMDFPWWKYEKNMQPDKHCECVNGSLIRPRAKLLFMRSETYGDKQREAQRRKKQEELWEKSNAEGVPTSEAPTNADKSDQTPNKTKKKDTPGRRSA
jgi:hypothetical protein